MVILKPESNNAVPALGHRQPGNPNLGFRSAAEHPELPKSVLYVVTQSAPGGAQRYVLDLATSLPRSYEPIIGVGCDGGGGLLDLAKQAGLQTITLQALRRSISPLLDRHAIVELRRLYDKLRPSIIHLNSTKAGVLGSIAGGYKYCTVYTVHGWVFREQLPLWKTLAYMGAEKISARYLDGIIVLSESDYRAGAQLRIKRGKMRVIHNGIQHPQFISRSSAHQRISELCSIDLSERKLVLCIASFYPTKGISTLIRAMAAVDKRAVAVVLGDGELRLQLKHQIQELGLQASVFLPGYVPDAAELLLAADVFVLPSLKEGMPYALLEAMAAAVPIVATDVGGVREILSHRIVKAGDADELAAALNEQLLQPVHASQLPPTLKEMADQTVELYDQLIEQKSQAAQR